MGHTCVVIAPGTEEACGKHADHLMGVYLGKGLSAAAWICDHHYETIVPSEVDEVMPPEDGTSIDPRLTVDQ